ncbi:hypothetical protein PTSG_00710 [Salpingoeca rosetta]|uniref:TNFR-Cys domain-containing protein n=1 Tax=Salpingoeca rosetta (strain ATCC 50818 / BSB-021) TaxID=946362 RepID=F2TX94_SALR5|nr:uncharacterized protein PTSG_00710 [Salpingoeca rosetta]EGD76003.1 hypothetical protein PTSG_00710 [Salpingoeca rosetta]|eukprot:XP_004998178.1 hypothetical protein PTSG_00710 [Salpingoeca rosetta]
MRGRRRRQGSVKMAAAATSRRVRPQVLLATAVIVLACLAPCPATTAPGAVDIPSSARILVWGEDFNDVPIATGIGNDTTPPAGSLSWNITAAQPPAPRGYFKVVPVAAGAVDHVLEAHALGTSARWSTGLFYTECAVNLTAGIHLEVHGTLQQADSLVVYYLTRHDDSGGGGTTTTTTTTAGTTLITPTTTTAAATTTTTTAIPQASTVSMNTTAAATTTMRTSTMPPPTDGGSGSGVDPGIFLPHQSIEVARITAATVKQQQQQQEGNGTAGGVWEDHVLFFSDINANYVQLGVEVVLGDTSDATFVIDNITLHAAAPLREEAHWSPWSPIAWSNWTQWEPQECNVNQTRTRTGTRTRTCVVPNCAPPASTCNDGGASEEVAQTDARPASDNCCGPVHGGWSNWTVAPSLSGEWTEWSPAQCGVEQQRTRQVVATRTCTSPAPLCGGAPCAGNATRVTTEQDTRTAADNCCPVDGGWTAWLAGEWSPWSAFSPDTCGVEQTRTRIRRRTRTCTQPAPACGGLPCPGNSTHIDTETQTRNASANCCAVDGEWSQWAPEEWSNWSDYTPSECGVEQRRERLRTRVRTCTDPAPVCGGSACVGSPTATDTQSQVRTAEENCCSVNGNYTTWRGGPWSAWTDYSPAGCGVNQTRARTQVQTRTCTNPSPACGGLACTGPDTRDYVDIEYRTAEENCCPVDGNFTAWQTSEWSQWSAYTPDVCGVAQNRTRRRIHTRNCTAPAPSCGGRDCVGETRVVDTRVGTRTAEENCCPVDGQFGEWQDGSWTEWSEFAPEGCGIEQSRFRQKQQTRECNNPPPSCGGVSCSGERVRIVEDVERRVADEYMDGGWSDPMPVSEWTEWSQPWPADCAGPQTQNRTRMLNRTCTNPAPQCNGRPCEGDATLVDIQVRNVTWQPVDGAFGAWFAPDGSEWSAWSAFDPPGCDVAQQRNRTRVEVRTCTNPAPACGGRDCVGATTRIAVQVENRTAAESCVPGCVRNATYTPWQEGSWSAWEPPLDLLLCDTPQGQARTRRRMRECVAPVCGGQPCTEDLAEAVTEQRSMTLRNLSADVSEWLLGNWSAWTTPNPGDNCPLVSNVWVRRRQDARTCAIPPNSCNQDACAGVSTQRTVRDWSLGPTAPSSQPTAPTVPDAGTTTTTTVTAPNGTTSNSNSTASNQAVFRSQDCCDGFQGWAVVHMSEWSAWGYPDIDALGLPCNSTHEVQRTRSRNVTRACDAAGTPCASRVCVGDARVVEDDMQTVPVSALQDGWSSFVFGEWSDWQFVDTIGCGQQRVRVSKRVGVRTCTSPWPSCRCVGPQTVTNVRNETVYGEATCDSACRVDGGWSLWVSQEGSWTPWTPWLPKGCGVEQRANRTRTLVRSCVNPSPACGGRDCEGPSTTVDVAARKRSAEDNCCGCITCQPGRYLDQFEPSRTACRPCPAGTVGDGAQCAQCSPGVYVPEGSVPDCEQYACEEGYTDHDFDPATPCVPCSATGCPSGSFPLYTCTATQDLRCAPCPPDTFSPDGVACRACDAPCENGSYAASVCDGKSNFQCLPCTPESTCPFGVKRPCEALVDTTCFASPEEANASNDGDSGGAGLSQAWLIVVLCLGGLFIATNCYWVGRSCNRTKQSDLYPINEMEMSTLSRNGAVVKLPHTAGVAPVYADGDSDSGLAETPLQAWMLPGHNASPATARRGAEPASAKLASPQQSGGSAHTATTTMTAATGQTSGAAAGASNSQTSGGSTGGGSWWSRFTRHRSRSPAAPRSAVVLPTRDFSGAYGGDGGHVHAVNTGHVALNLPMYTDADGMQAALESRTTPSPQQQRRRPAELRATQRRKPGTRPKLYMQAYQPSSASTASPSPRLPPRRIAGDESGSSICSVDPSPDYLTAAAAVVQPKESIYATAGASTRRARRMTQRLQPSAGRKVAVGGASGNGAHAMSPHQAFGPSPTQFGGVSLQRDDHGDVVVDDREHSSVHPHLNPSNAHPAQHHQHHQRHTRRRQPRVNHSDSEGDADASSVDSDYCVPDDARDVEDPPYARANDVGIYSSMTRSGTVKSGRSDATDATYARAEDFPQALPASAVHTYAEPVRPWRQHSSTTLSTSGQSVARDGDRSRAHFGGGDGDDGDMVLASPDDVGGRERRHSSSSQYASLFGEVREVAVGSGEGGGRGHAGRDSDYDHLDRSGDVRGSVWANDERPGPLVLHDDEMEEGFYSIFSAHATNDEEVPARVRQVFNNLKRQHTQPHSDEDDDDDDEEEEEEEDEDAEDDFGGVGGGGIGGEREGARQANGSGQQQLQHQQQAEGRGRRGRGRSSRTSVSSQGGCTRASLASEEDTWVPGEEGPMNGRGGGQGTAPATATTSARASSSASSLQGGNSKALSSASSRASVLASHQAMPPSTAQSGRQVGSIDAFIAAFAKDGNNNPPKVQQQQKQQQQQEDGEIGTSLTTTATATVTATATAPETETETETAKPKQRRLSLRRSSRKKSKDKKKKSSSSSSSSSSSAKPRPRSEADIRHIVFVNSGADDEEAGGADHHHHRHHQGQQGHQEHQQRSGMREGKQRSRGGGKNKSMTRKKTKPRPRSEGHESPASDVPMAIPTATPANPPKPKPQRGTTTSTDWFSSFVRQHAGNE